MIHKRDGIFFSEYHLDDISEIPGDGTCDLVYGFCSRYLFKCAWNAATVVEEEPCREKDQGKYADKKQDHGE